MIANLNLGPPLQGMAASKPKNAGSESFGKSLEQKMSSKDGANPKEATPQNLPRIENRVDMKADKERPEDPELKVEKGKLPGAKEKVSDREKAIKKFMDSFESEFGIPPTRLVEAIANLDQSEQLKSPEETADEVIAQLGLDEKDQARAQAMYASLLVSLSQNNQQQASVKPMLTAAQKSFGDEFRQRMELASSQRNATNMGVDRLNQKFWMNPQAEQLQTQMQMPGEVGSGDEALIEGLKPQLQAQTGKLELPPHLRGQLEQNASPALMAALAAKIAQAKAAQQGQSAEDSDSKDSSDDDATAGKSPLEALLKKPEVSVPGGLGALAAANPQEQGQSEFGQSSEQGSNELAKHLAAQKEHGKSSEKLLQKADFKQALQKGLDGLNAQALPGKAETHGLEVAAPAGALAAAQTPTSAEHETNIRQLMNQAQYLIKKGGGEMKVQMTPEGLGPVHLKVMLQDGKVNVQMSAATDDAKKAIESSLADLKTSLAAHKLSVDHVKVDVVNSPSTDTATNNQMNSNAQRDGTRQFWNQFNDNFGSQNQRDSFLDMTNLKGYTQPKRDPLQPIETASVRTRSVEGKGQGLNLVA